MILFFHKMLHFRQGYADYLLCCLFLFYWTQLLRCQGFSISSEGVTATASAANLGSKRLQTPNVSANSSFPIGLCRPLRNRRLPVWVQLLEKWRLIQGDTEAPLAKAKILLAYWYPSLGKRHQTHLLKCIFAKRICPFLLKGLLRLRSGQG